MEAFSTSSIITAVIAGIVLFVLVQIQKFFKEARHARETIEAEAEMGMMDHPSMREVQFDHTYEVMVPYWIYAVARRVGLPVTHSTFPIIVVQMDGEEVDD